MINRRKWFGLMAMAPVGIPAYAIASAKEGDEPKKNLLTLTMQSDRWRPAKDDPKLDLSIGNDGYLWIRPNGSDKWKRVVTE